MGNLVTVCTYATLTGGVLNDIFVFSSRENAERFFEKENGIPYEIYHEYHEAYHQADPDTMESLEKRFPTIRSTFDVQDDDEWIWEAVIDEVAV